MENIMGLIVVFILLLTLGIQFQIRNMSKKIDELLDKKQ
jgi:hypothetical protein